MEPISLSKGSNISLTKTAPGLKRAIIGLGWDPRATDGQDFDLDASAFMLNADGKCAQEKHFIFYNEMVSPCKSVTHTGDNRTGEGDGDDEQLIVDLTLVPADVEKIAITVTIHDAAVRNQNFGQVGGAFIRIVDADTSNPDATADDSIVRYDLQEDYSTETAMVFGELYRHNGDWKFRAVGQGYAGGLGAMAAQYGLSAA